MRAIILVYQLQEDEYPTLCELPKEYVQAFVQQGHLELDLPDNLRERGCKEDVVMDPVDVIVVG